MTTLTFIIPVRHFQNSQNWGLLKRNLQQTLASISAQTHDDWRCLIVANRGSDIPSLPHRVDVVWVDFPPNMKHERTTCNSLEEFWEAVRLDKGRRILSGMLQARNSRFFMTVDDDDFIHSQITQHAAEHPDANGWAVDHGYLWSDGGRLLLLHDDFNSICGTSLIVRSDLYELPQSIELATSDYIQSMLGSHVMIKGILAQKGQPLERLPFRGAIYRVGQAASHSRIPGILQDHFLNRNALRRPLSTLRKVRRLRIVDDAVRAQFFGGGTV